MSSFVHRRVQDVALNPWRVGGLLGFKKAPGFGNEFIFQLVVTCKSFHLFRAILTENVYLMA